MTPPPTTQTKAQQPEVILVDAYDAGVPVPQLPDLYADALADPQPEHTVFSRAALTEADLERPDVPTAGVAPGLTITPDGVAISGLCWCSDYRSEEEYGARDLRKLIMGKVAGQLTPTPDAHRYVAKFSDVRAIVLATRPLPDRPLVWGEHIIDEPWWDGTKRPAPQYCLDFERRASYTRGDWSQRFDLERLKVTELRERAREAGVTGTLPRTKAALVNAIVARNPVPTPNRWPAWFHDGQTLVIRIDDEPDGTTSVAGRVLDALIDAVDAGTLALGDGSGPFSTGLFIHDSRDITPALSDAVQAVAAWDAEQMQAVAPIERKLRREGMAIYHLGSPRPGGWQRGAQTIVKSGEPRTTIREGGTTRYWLNASLPNRGGQMFGWFTIDELTLDNLRRQHAEDEAYKRSLKS